MNGAFILESDTQDNVIATWQYPALEPELEEVILGQWKALLHKKKEAEPAGPTTVMFTSYSRFKQTWIYVSTKVFVRPLDEKGEVILDATEADDELFPKVYAIAVVIIADNFNPAKFLDFSNLLLTLYNKDGHPLNLLKCYLAVFIKGKVGDKYNLKNYKEYDEIEKTEVSGARDLINTFGEEVILIWCALMLKKRIAVYAGDVDRLYAVLRALPQLVPHRRGPWTNTNVWPYISGLKSELANLAEMGVYTAGFIDMEVVTANIGLFDLVVDASSQSVTVPQHAAETFVLTKFHKDLTAYLVTAAEDAATSEKDIVDGLELRIQSILDKLDTLKVATTEDGKKYVTMDQIHAVGKVNPPFDKFLFAVAQAEGMTSDAAAAAASSSSNDDDAADDKQQQQEQ